MIRISFIAIIVLLPVSAATQSLQAKLELIVAEISTGTDLIHLDSLAFNENNRYESLHMSPGLIYHHKVGKRLELSAGVKYRSTYVSFRVARDTGPPFGFVNKGTGVALKTFEFPITLRWKVRSIGKSSFHLFGGMMPVINKKKYGMMTSIPGGVDWSQGVVDLINRAHTVLKAGYINYHYGFSYEFWRIGIDVMMHQNASRNLGRPLQFNNQTFNFWRKTVSLRAGIRYCFVSFE